MTLWSPALPLSPRSGSVPPLSPRGGSATPLNLHLSAGQPDGLGPLRSPRRAGYPAQPIDRSQWKKLAYERNPHIQELTERLFPLQRAAKLVELNQQPPAPASVADIRKCCRLLVMQAFAYYGYSESLDNMQRESGLRCTCYLHINDTYMHAHAHTAHARTTHALTSDEELHLNRCMLRHYLSQAVQHMERVYDLFLGTAFSGPTGRSVSQHKTLVSHRTLADPDGDESEEALEEHLTKVGWKDGDEGTHTHHRTRNT
jgi:hypothetical protein